MVEQARMFAVTMTPKNTVSSRNSVIGDVQCQP